MQKLQQQKVHFPNPNTSIVTIIVTDWVKKRIDELSKAAQTPANKNSLLRFRKADPKKILMEPPVIMDDGTMKVCVLSRKAGTMWIDQVIDKLEWSRFIKEIDPTDAFSKLETTTPGLLTKEDLLSLAESYTSEDPIGEVFLVDLEGSNEKGLVFITPTMEITPEVFTKSFLKNYGFEELEVVIKNKEDSDYPVLDKTLMDMSIGTLSITEDLLKEGTVNYRLFSLPTIRGLLHQNDTTTYNGAVTHNGFIKY